jgi:hypothetical protein
VDTWWWLALGGVVALSLVTALIDGGARLGRPFRFGRRPASAPLPDRGPRPGEIWWTRAPLLVLVLAVRLESARVARISAELPGDSRLLESDAGNPGKLALPPGTVADTPGRVSALLTDEAWDVKLTEFGQRAGEVDPDTWAQVRHLAGEG